MKEARPPPLVFSTTHASEGTPRAPSAWVGWRQGIAAAVMLTCLLLLLALRAEIVWVQQHRPVPANEGQWMEEVVTVEPAVPSASRWPEPDARSRLTVPSGKETLRSPSAVRDLHNATGHTAVLGSTTTKVMRHSSPHPTPTAATLTTTRMSSTSMSTTTKATVTLSSLTTAPSPRSTPSSSLSRDKQVASRSTHSASALVLPSRPTQHNGRCENPQVAPASSSLAVPAAPLFAFDPSLINPRSKTAADTPIHYDGLLLFPFLHRGSSPLVAAPPTSPPGITISTHLTVERVDRLLAIAERWSHPDRVSAAVYMPWSVHTQAALALTAVPDRPVVSLTEAQLSNLRSLAASVVTNITRAAASHPCMVQPCATQLLANVDVHLVVALQDRPPPVVTRTWDPDPIGVWLPLNTLRNIAWRYVQTEFVLHLDVDFVPTEPLQAGLHRLLAAAHGDPVKRVWSVVIHMLKCAKTALAIAAGGRPQGCERSLMLKTHPSQRSNDLDRWEVSSHPYGVDYSFLFEPYLVTPAVGVPPFDERFLYGADKVAWAYDVALAGFEFTVVPPGAGSLEHWPHPPRAGTRPLGTKDWTGLLATVTRRARCLHWGVAPHVDVCNDLRARSEPDWPFHSAFFTLCGCDKTARSDFANAAARTARYASELAIGRQRHPDLAHLG